MHRRLTIALAATGLIGFIACNPTDEEVSESDVQSLSGEVSLWDTTAVPVKADDADDAAVELGVRFKTDVAGSLNGIRFYKSRANTGQHTAHLWSNNGQLLASATFTAESATGWQTVRFASPVALTAGGTYVASYHTDVGHYAGDNGFFRRRSVDRAPLHAVADGSGGANGVYRYGAVAFPSRSYQATNYWVDVLFAPRSSGSVDAGAPVVDAGGPVPDAGGGTPDAAPTNCPNAPHTPGGPDGMGGCWPYEGNTGVPAGTVLTDYTGPCTITTPNTVINAKNINCHLIVRAAGVVITNSKINGRIANDDCSNYSFTVSDTRIHTPDINYRGLSSCGFTATRVDVTGGQSMAWCGNNCTIKDSYLHSPLEDAAGAAANHAAHNSTVRVAGSGAKVLHNTLWCEVKSYAQPDGQDTSGCSANQTAYSHDGAAPSNALIEGNLYMPTTGGFCAYGGSTTGALSSVHDMVFRNNVFKRGDRKSDHGLYVCGYYGTATSFDSSRPGNKWENNRFDDGALVNP